MWTVYSPMAASDSTPRVQLSKHFDVRDDLEIRLIQQAGPQIAFLSGGQGGATEVWTRQLGIRHCLDKPAANTPRSSSWG